MHEKRRIKVISLINKLGLLLVALALLGALIVYSPIIFSEVGYLLRKNKQVENFSISRPDESHENLDNFYVPVDMDFSIIIPKINANYRVIKDIDSQDPGTYQKALSSGVAHALGTVYPGEVGNSFYFAHSSDTVINANAYNALFYLIRKLEIGDRFFLIYENDIFEYEVIKTAEVSEDRTDLLNMATEEKMATLMTCWPPGTSLRRLVVIGRIVD